MENKSEYIELLERKNINCQNKFCCSFYLPVIDVFNVEDICYAERTE
jgi:hypothetical protein